MELRKLAFMTRYYAANLIKSKIGGPVRGLFLDREARRWETLRVEVPKSDTWLVVGNGPSLRADDLTALRGMPSVASNKINLIFDNTDSRPTLYTITDPLLLFKLPKSHFEKFDMTLVPHSVGSLVRNRRALAWRHLSFSRGVET